MAVKNQVPDAAIYERAAEIIEERGLAKGIYLDDRGSVCAYGALALAIGERKRIRQVFDEDGFTVPKVDARIPQDILDAAGVGEGLADWNDMKSRRKAQVAAKLRQMAEAERSRH